MFILHLNGLHCNCVKLLNCCSGALSWYLLAVQFVGHGLLLPKYLPYMCVNVCVNVFTLIPNIRIKGLIVCVCVCVCVNVCVCEYVCVCVCVNV